MNNLKRVLALGLSGTMLSGMMMMGAGAVGVTDFTDGSEINNQEAVTTMAALGVILGKDTGAFDPTGSVTRAEMAKMITVMLNGGKDPVLSPKAVPTYSDIDNHWAESYIEYCSNEGVISGQGDGTFAPDGSVTGSQAAKMALVALGYDSAAYNFTGIDWEVNTNRYANAEADLYDGLETLDPSQPLNRDNAAQMLYNVLDAKTKKMTPTTSTNGNIEYTYTDGGSFMQEKFGAVKVEGVVIANEMANLTASAANGGHLDTKRTEVRVTNYGTGNGEQTSFGNAAGTATVIVQATTGLDELGRSVSVYVKSGSSRTRAEIMGDVILSEDNVVVTDYSGDSIDKVADDNSLDVVAGTTLLADNFRNATAITAGTATANATRGVEKVLVDNDDDGTVDYVLRNTYAFGKVTSYVTTGDGAITVSAGTTLTASDKKDVLGFDDVARNDYVLAAYIGGRLFVEKAETITGELESYRTDSSGNTTKLEVEGTNYNVSHIAGYTQGADNIIDAKSYGASNLDTEATFYMGKGEYIAAVGEVVENAYNYALVLAGDTNNVTNQVRLVLSDGTKGTYAVNTNGQTFDSNNTIGSINDSTFGVGSVCSYTIGSNGTIRLTEVAPANGFNAANATAFSKGRTAITDNNNTVYANGSTAFFFVGAANFTNVPNNKVNTYTGYTSAPSVTGATSYVYTNAAGRAVAVVFVGTGITTADVDDFVYIYGTGNSNNERTVADAFVAGGTEGQSIMVDGKVYAYANNNTLHGSTTASEGLYKYSINSNNYYELSAIDDYTGVANTGNKIVSDYNASTTPGGTTYGVYSASGRTVVIGEWNPGTQAFDTNLFEVKITANTMLVDDSSDLDAPALEVGGTPEEGDKIAYALFNLDGNIADEAMLIVTKRNQAVAAQPAAPAPTAALDAGSNNNVTVASPVNLVANGSVNATVTGFVDTTADTVKVTFTASNSETIDSITYTVDGANSTAYTSGNDIDLGTATGTVTLEFTVNSSKANHAATTTTYTVVIDVQV